VDESKGYVVVGKATMRQPGQKMALVFDEEIKKTPGVSAAFNLFQGLGIEVIEADTIEDLASKIGAPAATLKVTVEEFNNSVKDGKALDIKPSKGANAIKIMTPKFYAFYPMVPGITLTFGGSGATNTSTNNVDTGTGTLTLGGTVRTLPEEDRPEFNLGRSRSAGRGVVWWS
jgi:hypothetical protein